MPKIAPEQGDRPSPAASSTVRTRSSKVWVVQMSAYCDSLVLRLWLYAYAPASLSLVATAFA